MKHISRGLADSGRTHPTQSIVFNRRPVTQASRATLVKSTLREVGVSNRRNSIEGAIQQPTIHSLSNSHVVIPPLTGVITPLCEPENTQGAGNSRFDGTQGESMDQLGSS